MSEQYLASPPDFPRNSTEVRSNADRLLAPGAQDYARISGSPEFPRFFSDARGACLFDAEGRSFTDFYLGSGAVILGHGDPGQVEYVRCHLQHGATVSLRHPVEVALAGRLQALIPTLDRFVFFKTGSECAHFALRLALKATGRRTVISLGYHGWITPFGEDSIRGADMRVAEAPWELEAALSAICDAGTSLAALVVSPTPFATSPEFYQRLVREARAVGALVIMDEIKSGFRFRFPCASEAFGLDPDLLLLAKALTNGFPLAALGGKDELLGDERLTSVFSTYASETVSLFASLYALDALANGAYARFLRASRRLHTLLVEALEGSGIAVVGDPAFFRLALPEGADPGVLAARLAGQNLIFHPLDEVLVSAAHDDDALMEGPATALAEHLRAGVARPAV